MGDVIDLAVERARRRSMRQHPSAQGPFDRLRASAGNEAEETLLDVLDPDGVMERPTFACGRCRSQWWRLVSGVSDEGFQEEPMIRLDTSSRVQGWSGRLVCDGCGDGPIDGPGL